MLPVGKIEIFIVACMLTSMVLIVLFKRHGWL